MEVIMDYKEKYEMALEGIQEILGSGEDSIKMSRLQLRLQGIFPELTESEDERIRKGLIGMLSKYKYYYSKEIAWLKKQGKPSDEEMKTLLRTEYEKGRADAIAEMQGEWSEEDEETLGWLCTFLKGYGHEFYEGNEENDVIDWLKSLRPQNRWKPSDEQLKVLHDAAIYIDHSMFPCQKGFLMKLYKQLKRLK